MHMNKKNENITRIIVLSHSVMPVILIELINSGICLQAFALMFLFFKFCTYVALDKRKLINDKNRSSPSCVSVESVSTASFFDQTDFSVFIFVFFDEQDLMKATVIIYTWIEKVPANLWLWSVKL